MNDKNNDKKKIGPFFFSGFIKPYIFKNDYWSYNKQNNKIKASPQQKK